MRITLMRSADSCTLGPYVTVHMAQCRDAPRTEVSRPCICVFHVCNIKSHKVIFSPQCVLGLSVLGAPAFKSLTCAPAT